MPIYSSWNCSLDMICCDKILNFLYDSAVEILNVYTPACVCPGGIYLFNNPLVALIHGYVVESRNCALLTQFSPLPSPIPHHANFNKSGFCACAITFQTCSYQTAASTLTSDRCRRLIRNGGIYLPNYVHGVASPKSLNASCLGSFTGRQSIRGISLQAAQTSWCISFEVFAETIPKFYY